jgi:hypothetical protein
MKLDRNISSTQITWVIGLIIGLACSVMLGSAIGGQDFRLVALFLGGGVGIATFLVLGKHYWLLIPFSLGAKLPTVPLGGRAVEFPELAIAACFVFFILRIATRKEKLELFRAVNVPYLLMISWVGMVFIINPIGLAMLGSSIGGGRFYLKLGLAFASFLVLSNRNYSEKDMKWVIGLLVFGAFFTTIYGITDFFLGGPEVDPNTGMVLEGFYTWHQVLSWPAFTIAFLIFSRWSPREIFGLQRPGVLIIYFACFILVLLSGKRMGLVAVLLAPAVSAVMNRQFAYFPVALATILVMLAIVVGGQGQFFNLPLVAQRTLSWLPGAWDAELQHVEGGADKWRAELRRFAMENIARDPLIGRGFSVDLAETLSAVGMQRFDGSVEAQTLSYALGRSWHNVWLGYAADFGIPFSIMQGILLSSVLFLSARCYKLLGNRSLMGVFSLYVFIFTVRDLVASWTSGHSAVDAFERWWMYGILVAIYLQIQTTARKNNKGRRGQEDPRPFSPLPTNTIPTHR